MVCLSADQFAENLLENNGVDVKRSKLEGRSGILTWKWIQEYLDQLWNHVETRDCRQQRYQWKFLQCVSFACNFSTHVNDTHLFVTLNDHWVEETVSFKMSQDFLRQVLITSFPGAHEADHYSTARFHESDTWLSFALCHCSNEHVVRLEFWQCIRRLVHHNSSVRRTSSTTRNTDRAPIFEWNVCRVVCHSRSICRWFRST